jgi:hypothetical protein
MPWIAVLSECQSAKMLPLGTAAWAKILGMARELNACPTECRAQQMARETVWRVRSSGGRTWTGMLKHTYDPLAFVRADHVEVARELEPYQAEAGPRRLGFPRRRSHPNVENQ